MPSATKFGSLYWVSAIALTSLALSQSSFPDTEVGFGKCLRFPAFPSFSLDKFLGVWHLDHQHHQKRFLPCQIFNFTKTSNFTMKIKASVMVGHRLSLTNEGISTSDNLELGLMKWSWNYMPAMMEHVTVIETDYDSYAALILCSDYGLIHINYVFGITRRVPMQTYYGHNDNEIINKTNEATSSLVKTNYYYPHAYYCVNPDIKVKNVDIDKTLGEIGHFFSSLTKM